MIGTQPIRVGDFIKLDSGEEGYVTEIGWRAARIRMLPNNTVIVPNSKLADSVITNYYLPEKELAVLVQVGVSYNCDLVHVERVTIEVAKEIQQKKGEPGGFSRPPLSLKENSLKRHPDIDEPKTALIR